MSKLPNATASYQFFENCRTQDLDFETNTIIGYPDEGSLEFEESLSIIFDSIALGGIAADVSVLQPLPGAAVTLENAGFLEFPEKQPEGAFLPREGLSMARSDSQLFSGFWFIRKNNREFEYYTVVVSLVRFFTRHFFRTIYFLKNTGHLSYAEIFKPMLTMNSPEQYRSSFINSVLSRYVGGELDSIFKTLLTYEDAIFQLQSIDVNAEVGNVYSQPLQRSGAPTHFLLELDYDVLELRSSSSEPQKHHYLLYRNDEGDVVTVRLTDWQRELWLGLEEGELSSAEQIEACAQTLVHTLGARVQDARDAAASLLKLFNSVNNGNMPDTRAHEVMTAGEWLSRAGAVRQPCH